MDRARARRRLGGLLLGCLLACAPTAACLISPDPALWMSRGDRQGPAERAADRGFVERSSGESRAEAAPPPCSAEGLQASCDPIAGSGCGPASCYLIAKQGPSCVCPPGTVAAGGSCNSTRECAPGQVCAGTVAPGICRAMCDPASPSCATGQCTFIGAFPTFGYCAPVDAGS